MAPEASTYLATQAQWGSSCFEISKFKCHLKNTLDLLLLENMSVVISFEHTDFKNVIFENIHWAHSEDAEVAEVKRPQNPK